MERMLFMTHYEIMREYQDAKHKGRQIKILADENVCTKDEIIEILKKFGIYEKGVPRRKRTRQRTTQPTTKV